jgi:hypothetical protein
MPIPVPDNDYGLTYERWVEHLPHRDEKGVEISVDDTA